VECIISLVKNYYQGEDFCILTAYDAQRNLLEERLKASGLKWDKVFNVDSFQGNSSLREMNGIEADATRKGNEADHALISVVRTARPGFLNSQNRVNVMLTRCKKGMVIVSSKSFLGMKPVQPTLLGRIKAHWERRYGEQACWVTRKEILNRTAVLPVKAKRGLINREVFDKLFHAYTVRITQEIIAKWQAATELYVRQLEKELQH
jgi:hypothetical protein